MSVLPSRVALVALATVLLCAAEGCAGAMDVKRTFTPDAAARVDEDKLKPEAVLRDGERIPMPPGARVEADRIVIPGRHGRPERTFALRRTDGVVMRGAIPPGEEIPGGGRVESSRSGGALIGGVALLTLAYAPTAYLGATASRPEDHVLAIPVAGPWLDLAHRPVCVPPQSPIPLPVDPCAVETATRAALVTSGALQGLGALITLIGLPSSAHVVEGADKAVAVQPRPGGASVSFSGRF